MPQATEELRDRMGSLFGDAISDQGPMKYLEDAGFKLTRQWEWKPRPGAMAWGDLTQSERDCIWFLVTEWDFGGLAKPDRGVPIANDPDTTTVEADTVST